MTLLAINFFKFLSFIFSNCKFHLYIYCTIYHVSHQNYSISFSQTIPFGYHLALASKSLTQYFVGSSGHSGTHVPLSQNGRYCIWHSCCCVWVPLLYHYWRNGCVMLWYSLLYRNWYFQAPLDQRP